MDSRGIGFRSHHRRHRRTAYGNSHNSKSGFGGCMVFIGVLSLIVSLFYVVGPNVGGLEFNEAQCIISSIEVSNNLHACDCGDCPLRTALAPCVEVYVRIVEFQLSSKVLLRMTRTSLEERFWCTFENIDECFATKDANILVAEAWANSTFTVGDAVKCYYNEHDREKVVLDREYDESGTTRALTWPLIITLAGCCFLYVGSRGSRGCCCKVKRTVVSVDRSEQSTRRRQRSDSVDSSDSDSESARTTNPGDELPLYSDDDDDGHECGVSPPPYDPAGPQNYRFVPPAEPAPPELSSVEATQPDPGELPPPYLQSISVRQSVA